MRATLKQDAHHTVFRMLLTVRRPLAALGIVGGPCFAEGV